MADIHYPVAHREQREIDSFKSRYEDFDERVIPEIFANDLNLTVTGWQRSQSWGSSHVIYFVQINERDDELVLRANLGVNPEPEVVMLTEKLITDVVAGVGVPTNRVLDANVSRSKYDFDYQIQEKLQGRDLEDHFSGTKEEYDALSYQIGQLVAQYHALEYSGFGRFANEFVTNEQLLDAERLQGNKTTFYDYILLNLDSDIGYLVDGGVVSKKTGKIMMQIFDEHRDLINNSPNSLLHYDLADHNIMFAGDEITGIFDWETAVVGDPALDLASCPTWRTHYPREEHLLAGYESVRALPDNWPERRNIYLLRTMLWKTVYAIRMDIMNPERIQRFTDVLAAFRLS